MTAVSSNLVDTLSPKQTAEVAESTALYKATKKTHTTLISAIVAGVFISIAFAFYITATTGTSNTIPFGLAKLVGGICFSLGLTLVVCLGADLFTSSILVAVPLASKKITFTTLINNWSLVYVGNFIGALLFVALIWYADEHLLANGLWGLNVLQTAAHKLEHSFIAALMLGILANLMVCLAVWMSYAGRSLTDKMLIMIFPVAMFVACGFEHSIANMFMIPLGIIIHQFANPEFWQMVHIAPEHFAELTISNFIIKNLIPVTIGNIIGGLMVGLTYWHIHLRK